MKRKFVFIGIILLFCFFANLSMAKLPFDYKPKQGKGHLKPTTPQSINFIISLAKYYYESNPFSQVRVLIRLDVYLENSQSYYRNEEKDVWRNYQAAKQVIMSFRKYGWESVSPFAQTDIILEPILICTQRRMNIKFKRADFFEVFIYPCDPDPLFNKKKCYGNLGKCFSGVAKKVEQCLHSRGFVVR